MHLLQIIRKYTLKDTDVKPDTFIADLVVDVPPGQCDKAYVYMSDFSEYGIVVYSWEKNDSWRISHHFFHFDPLNGNVHFKNRSSIISAPSSRQGRLRFSPCWSRLYVSCVRFRDLSAGNYNVNGYNFQWTDGVFGMSLSPIRSDGNRTLYFHAMSGIHEFSVSTDVLKDDTLQKSSDYYNFHVVGNKGLLTQGPSSIIDPETCINYFTQVNKNGIACWNTKTKLTQETFSKYYPFKYSRSSFVRSYTQKLVNGRNHLSSFWGPLYVSEIFNKHRNCISRWKPVSHAYHSAKCNHNVTVVYTEKSIRSIGQNPCLNMGKQIFRLT